MIATVVFLRKINDGENKVWVDLKKVLDDFAIAYANETIVNSGNIQADLKVTFNKNQVISNVQYNEFVSNSFTQITTPTTTQTTIIYIIRKRIKINE